MCALNPAMQVSEWQALGNSEAAKLQLLAKLLGIMLAPLTSFAINLGALAKKRAEEEGAAA